MSNEVSYPTYLRTGTDAEHSIFLGEPQELTMVEDLKELALHLGDGKLGGYRFINKDAIEIIVNNFYNEIEQIRQDIEALGDGDLLSQLEQIQQAIEDLQNNILDIQSINATIQNIQTDILNLQSALAGKANIVHTHTIADVTGLQDIINGITIQSIGSVGWSGQIAFQQYTKLQGATSYSWNFRTANYAIGNIITSTNTNTANTIRAAQVSIALVSPTSTMGSVDTQAMVLGATQEAILPNGKYKITGINGRNGGWYNTNTIIAYQAVRVE